MNDTELLAHYRQLVARCTTKKPWALVPGDDLRRLLDLATEAEVLPQDVQA
jgi:hypothetical protein